VTEPLIPLDCASKDRQKGLTVAIVLDDRPLLIAARDHVNHCPRWTNAKRSGHSARLGVADARPAHRGWTYTLLAQTELAQPVDVAMQDLTPDRV
jgi:hypothetical protein